MKCAYCDNQDEARYIKFAAFARRWRYERPLCPDCADKVIAELESSFMIAGIVEDKEENRE